MISHAYQTVTPAVTAVRTLSASVGSGSGQSSAAAAGGLRLAAEVLTGFAGAKTAAGKLWET